MQSKVKFLVVAVISAFVLSACSMMAGMMGMGDLMGAMENMDAVMAMNMNQRKQHMMNKQSEMLARGEKLFNNSDLGSNGQNCNSCHPGGATTGGEAQVPMTQMKLPIPSLIGASARFPKFKVPNDRVITLAQMDNNCIKMFMKGKPMPLGTDDSIALAMYVTSLSNNNAVEVGKSN